MSFTDYLFLPALLIVIALYFVLPLKIRWYVLLAASVLFYWVNGSELIGFAFASTLVAWGGAIWIQRRYDQCAAQCAERTWQERQEKNKFINKYRKGNRWILWGAVLLILGVLVYMKLQQYLLQLPALSGMKVWLIPLGISYYSMSLVGYMADVYWKKEKAEKNLLKLFLFSIYFPKIVEGPISKHRLSAKSLTEGHNFDYQRFCFGFQRMLWGYFKKMVIADRLDLFVSTVLGNPSEHVGSVLFVAAIFSAFDLYCDFSGCMDIALGISEIFGITLEENFKQPFRSKTAAEFWRRWHITLGVWFKDYIYMPLVASPSLIRFSGKVKKKFGKRPAKAVVTVIPLMVVWLATGLWHGTGLNYILWGVYWGCLICISNVWEPEFKKLTVKLGFNRESAGYQKFQMIRTFFLFVISRLISYPKTLQDTAYIFWSFLKKPELWRWFNGDLYSYGLDRPNFILAIILIIGLIIVEGKIDTGISFREKIASYRLPARWLIYILGIVIVVIFGIYGLGYDASSFVYMNY